jgi:hypothetical protein
MSRRAVLRGIGTTLALPLLDGIASPQAFANVQGPRRLGVVYVPNGMAMEYWTPSKEGTDLGLTPILEPLAKYRQRMTVISGLTQETAPKAPGRKGGGGHAPAASKFLTGWLPERRAATELKAGISMDQVAAKEFGRLTQLASLELGLDVRDSAGSCAEGLCAYTGTIVWRDESSPLPMENNPRIVFERMFGDGESDAKTRNIRIRNQLSILDSVLEKVGHLSRDLGPGPRVKLEQYLESVRDVERRIQRTEEQNTQSVATIDQPEGIPATFEQHIKLMFDLQVLAYQTDLTRVITLMVGRETSGRTYPEIGISDAHHPLSHHTNDPERIERMSKINTYHTQMFAYLLDKMEATPDGDRSLLDNTVLLYGAGMSNSNVHSGEGLPILVVGGAGREPAGGRHVVCPKDTPVANLHLTVLQRLGINIESFGESTGNVEFIGA